MLTSALPFMAMALAVQVHAQSIDNSATVTAPAGLNETQPANNSATDMDAVLAALAATNDDVTGVNGADGADDVINVLTNDRINGANATIANTDIQIVTPAVPNNPGNPVPVLDLATGFVDVPAGTPAGTYTITYELCEEGSTTNCEQAVVTVEVLAAPITADNDAPPAVNGADGGDDIVNAFDNDTLNGNPVDPADISATITTPAAPASSGAPVPVLDPATGLVDVPAGTPAGTYTIEYEICETLNPTNCASGTITVEVEAPAIAATADAPPAVNGTDGGDDIVNAFDNDTLNGNPVDPAEITARIVAPATPATPGAPVPVMDTDTGLVDVPPATPADTYTIEYEICETLNPTNCATSTITVEVEAAPIEATDDTPDPVRSGIGNSNAINAFDNDTLNGDPVDPADITARVVTPAADPGIVMDTATGVVSVSADVPAGTYTIEYEICETLNPTNCATSVVTVVVEAPVSTVEGTVFTDVDGDGELDPGEPLLGGWIVEIIRDGDVVATTITDDSGLYRVEDLPSGPGYEIQFRNPENNVVFDIITDLTLGDNVTVVDQDLPIDPSGVIYNSVTREPLAATTATLLGPNGNPLPDICFLDPSQQSQTTGASGFYRFDVVPGAAAQCPTGETEYTIAIAPPAGFSFASSVLAPTDGPFDPTGLQAPVRISDSPDPPTGSNPTYYLTFALAAGDPDIINNHIPVDPFLNRTPLIVTKVSPKRSASTGDLIPYEITVRNAENTQRSNVTVVDILPPGLKYVLGTATVDGVADEPETANFGRQLEWRDQTIPAAGSVRYNLTLVVGAGVTNGEKVNTGVSFDGTDGSQISNRGTSVVQIVPSRIFDCSELIGKVFEDINRNGYQDEGEPGVPGVRLATVNGQLITTDEYGRYHITCAAVPNARIGSNFVLKLDTRTLPLGWDVVQDNPQSIRLTRGKFGELNFGVAPAPEDDPAKDAGRGE